jgi:hypothetical protein
LNERIDHLPTSNREYWSGAIVAALLAKDVMSNASTMMKMLILIFILWTRLTIFF